MERQSARRRALTAYAYYYNHLRSHQALDNQPPVEAAEPSQQCRQTFSTIRPMLWLRLSARLGTTEDAFGKLRRRVIPPLGSVERYDGEGGARTVQWVWKMSDDGEPADFY